MPSTNTITRWTAGDIPNQAGRTFIVTGANSGLGYVTTRELARRGAHVIMTARDRTRGERAIEGLRARQPDASLELRHLDLSDLESVKAFAQGIIADRVLVDVLINNAGIMMPPRSLTKDDTAVSGVGMMNRILLALTSGVLMVAMASSAGRPARFHNLVEPPEPPSAGVRAGLWLRKIWTSLAPRPGAAPRVPYGRAAIARNPSLTWIGHSTFLVRMDGVTFLTDPIFSDRAGPVSFAGLRRAVPPGVPLEALPAVDFVLLSHDHYDHADLPSVKRLAQLGARFVVPLGMGEWVREAGGEAIELDWWGDMSLDGVRIHCVPAQHQSGRSLREGGQRLWAGWVVAGPTRRFYHTGDTGHGAEFEAVGRRLGPIDLAAVPIGAYRPAEMMRYSHTTPEEALRIGKDAGALRVVAMHFGTFDLADEPLDEPPRRFRAEAERLGLGADRAWILRIGETREW